MQFVRSATLIRPKHDGEGGLVVELGQVLIGLGEQFHIGAPALDARLKSDFVLNNQVPLEGKRLVQALHNRVVSSLRHDSN